MQRAIWKYPLNMGQTNLILPEGSIPRAVGEQNNQMYLWVEQYTGPGVMEEEHSYFIAGTGHVLPDEWTETQFIGTVFQRHLVWHVYRGSM